MTYPEAIQYLYQLRWFGAKFGLANTFRLAAMAGHPEQQLRFIHVAGTNGKGSTCAMLESIYRTAGLRVGLFTSPHLVAFGERIQVNRQPVPEADVVRLVGELRTLLEQGWGPLPPSSPLPAPAEAGPSGIDPGTPAMPAEHPTFFEVVTIMALRYFAEQACDLVLWETGMGGRLDATNIVAPLTSIITNIQYDHQKWLGETLASIAAEKAGIIKPGVPVITGADAPEALTVITETARRLGAPLAHVTPAAMNEPPLDRLQLPLQGQHQRMNAAVALAAVRQLAGQIPVPEATLAQGLSQVRWAGRLQWVTRPNGQQFLLDGAHNVGGAEILATALRALAPAQRPALVLGILRDKDWPGMCQILAPLAGRILLVPVPSERSAEPHGLAEICAQANPAAQVTEHAALGEALAAAAAEPLVVIGGSLYLVGQALELLELSPARPLPERELNEWKAS